MKHKKLLIITMLLTIILLPIKVKAQIPLIIDCEMEDELQMKALCTISYEENGENVPDEVIIDIPGVNLFASYFKFWASDNWKITDSSISDGYKVSLRKSPDFKDNVIGTYECTLAGSSSAGINLNLWLNWSTIDGTSLNGGPSRNIFPNISDYESNKIFIGYDQTGEIDEENNTGTFTVDVSNNISKLILGTNPKSDNTISMLLDLYMWLGFADVSVNDNLIDKQNIVTDIKDLNESSCTFDNYDCTLYKDDYDKQFVYILKDNNSISYYRYVDFVGLNEGTNNITISMEGLASYNIIINRELTPIEETIPVEDTPNTDSSKEEPKNNNNNNIMNNITKELDSIIENPNTGILLSVSLSIVSILLIIFLYVKYYKKKKNII